MSKKIKAILSFALCLALMLTVILPSVSVNPVSAAIAYNEWDFEDEELGSGLPTYITGENNDGVSCIYSIAEDPADSTNKCLKIYDNSNARASVNIPFEKMYDAFTFEIRVRMDSLVGSTMGFGNNLGAITNSGAGQAAIFYWENDQGALVTYNGSTKISLGTYTAKTWIKLKFDIDPATDTFDLYMSTDGDSTYEVAQTGNAFRGGDFSYVNYFHFSPWANRKVTYYVDDIVSPKGKEKDVMDRYIPEYNKVEILYDGDTETPETDAYYTHNYCAFPTLLHLSDEEVMIVFKRGIGHAYAEAHDDIMIYNPKTEEIVSHESFYNVEGENPQNPELAKMPNGDIVAFLDRQTATAQLVSIGVKQYRLKYDAETGTYADEWVFDPGNTEDEATNNDEFALLQDTDGVQYFTNYDDVVVGDTIYMIASTDHSSASGLAGYGTYNTNGVCTVHIIKSTDNGYTWEHVKNISEEFGVSINESSFELLDNGGFFFVCRGNDERTTVCTTDAEFNLTNKRIVSDDYYSINYIGRPKIFKKDGEYYFICRNIRSDANEELALYRFDVENLIPETYVVIEEPMTTARAGNGHYAEPFFVEKDGVEYINIINYTNAYTCNPDIVKYELKWDEVKDPVIKTPVEEKTVTVAVPVAEKQSWNNAVTPIYNTDLSNLSLSFEYTAQNDAIWYFDVVDDDYSNCYSLNLTSGGMTLNRVVAGETTALATYSGLENGKYYEIQLVRYMEDITVFVDGVKAMTVAEEDAAYPVTTTGADTHWRGKLYLDDAKGSVTNIKVYDSGLITFENGYAILGNIALSDNISSLHAIATVNGTATVGEGTVSSTKDSVTATFGGGNPVVYTTGWLNEDVGDFVLTYTDCHYRCDWTSKALLLSATAKETPSGGQWIQVSTKDNGVLGVFESGDAILSGVNQYETNNRYFDITDGKITNDTGALGVGTIYSNVNVKVVKKADRLTVTIGNEGIGYETIYDGTSNNIVGNIFAAQFQGTTKARDIKVTDTVNSEEIVLSDDTFIAGDLTENGNLNSDDLVLMRKNLLKSYIPKAQKLADINIDKKVDVKDLVRLKKKIVEK